MAEPRYFSGQFLLATPGMADPRFSRSVIAICSHDEHGALGINISNTSPDISLSGILEQFEIDHEERLDRPVYMGGPVEMQRGFVLHSLDFNLSDTLQVGNQWGMTSAVEILHAIAQNRGPEKWMVALGYSGWGAGQLEEELTQNGWAVLEGTTDWLFDRQAKDKWVMAWESTGIDPAKLSGDFGSA